MMPTKPNSSLTKAFEDLLNSARNEKMGDDISGFGAEKYEWMSQQEGNHECCKCIKEHMLYSPDVKNIILKGNNFHFCGFDDRKKCTSSTNIETFVSDSSRRRRSSGEKNTKSKKRIKINTNGWTPATLQICLQDIYCSDVIFKYIEPKCRYERGTIVWAKMSGYPSWPAMIDNDPDYNTYWWITETSSMVQYHVVFFDNENFVSRCWSLETKIKSFSFKPFVNFKSMSIFQRFQAGFEQAKKALTMNTNDRIETYGFAAKMRQPNVTLVES